jgi:hypothetical protein
MIRRAEGLRAENVIEVLDGPRCLHFYASCSGERDGNQPKKGWA